MKSLFVSLATSICLTALTPACTAQPPEVATSAPQWTDSVSVASARQELTTLYETLKSAHFDLYVHQPKPAYDAKFEELMAGINEPLTRFELYLLLQKFAAYGNVAHARIDFPSEVYDDYRANGGRTFPIFLRIADGRVYVGEDYSGTDSLTPGDEILTLNGSPMSDWLIRTAVYLSADTPYIAHSLLEFSFPKLLWVEAGEQASFDLGIRKQNGEDAEVTIPARTRAEIRAAAETAPDYFALDGGSREARMLDNKIAYLQPGPFYNFDQPEDLWNTKDFSAFVDQAFEGFLKQNAETLIIDLRDNPGGDNSFSDLVISWIADERFRFASEFLIRSSDAAAASNQKRLDQNPDSVSGVSGLFADFYDKTPRGENFAFDIPYAFPRDGEKFTGEVYVLINRHSYSNAVTTAAMMQDYGWGIIAGEKTSDMATTYGAMESFILPITGFEVGFPKAHIIRPSGERESDGVTPDLTIQTPIVPPTEDVVLNALIEHIQAK